MLLHHSQVLGQLSSNANEAYQCMTAQRHPDKNRRMDNLPCEIKQLLQQHALMSIYYLRFYMTASTCIYNSYEKVLVIYT